MTIRRALRTPSLLAARKRGGEAPGWWCGSNAILAMMTAVFAIVCIVEILQG